MRPQEWGRGRLRVCATICRRSGASHVDYLAENLYIVVVW